MNDNQNECLTSTYLAYNIDALSALIYTVHNTLDTFFAHTLNHDVMDNLSSAMKSFIASYDALTKNMDISSVLKVCSQFLITLETISSPQIDLSCLKDNINIEEDDVNLSENAIETLSNFFVENDQLPTPQINTKMSTKDFLFNVMLPILLTILQMLQAVYYHNTDSLQDAAFQAQLLEAENQQLEEEIIQTEELQMQTEYLKQLIHFITNEFSANPEDAQEPLEEVLIVPSQIQSIQPESSPTLDTAGELSADADTILDVFDGHSTDE